jgi:hypothetical protein
MLGDVRRESENLDGADMVAPSEPHIYDLADHTGMMLDWLIRHDPLRARWIVQKFVGEVVDDHDRYQTTRDMLVHTLKVALVPGELTSEQTEGFLKTVIIHLDKQR